MNKILLFATLLSVCGVAHVSSVNAQAKYVIWDGTYTAAQAERGRAAYATHCIACHADDSRGGKAPALLGDVFMLHWETKTVGELFQKIRDTMPKRPAATEVSPVSDKDKIDIVAYLLQRNGYPAGGRELEQESELLRNIQMIPKDGPSPPRNGSIVEAIGCLEGQDDAWALTRSTGPQVTALDAPKSGARDAAAAAAIGSQTVRLTSVFPRPTQYNGHKMRATGFYVVTPARSEINVLSMESLSATCPQ